MAKIELININKDFSGSTKIDNLIKDTFKFKVNNKDLANSSGHFSISNLNLTLPDGKTTVILGPSGCGKSTLLRIIAGLLKQDSGRILFNGADIYDAAPKDRKIGMVFQDYALFPHFNSKKNILTYYLFKKKTEEINKEAEEKLKKTSELLGVDIKYLLNRKPTNLSGGEKQRVALGRCITRNPSLFLMDEPFSNMDNKLREKYRVQLKVLLRKFNITAVYVTHDQLEALLLADLLVVMNDGKIMQVGTYEEIYQEPENLFVAEFVNPNTETVSINFIDGYLISPELNDVVIGARPEDIEVQNEKKGKSISGKIIDIYDMPVKKLSIMDISIGDKVIHVKKKLKPDFNLNQNIWLFFKKYFIFDKKSGKRIYENSRTICC